MAQHHHLSARRLQMKIFFSHYASNANFVGHLGAYDLHKIVLVFKGNIWSANDNCGSITFQRSDFTGQIYLLLPPLTKLVPN